MERTPLLPQNENSGPQHGGELNRDTGHAGRNGQATTPLQRSKPSTYTSTIRSLQDNVAQSSLLEVQLLLLSFCTGIIDVMTISTYKVFSSKQTGNIIFIAIALLDVSPAEQQNQAAIVTSLVAFTIGSGLYSWIGAHLGHKRRIWLIMGNLFSAALILGAAALQQDYAGKRPIEGRPGDALVTGLCAVASGAQVALSMNVRGSDLNTSVVTSSLVAMTADQRLFAVHNAGRNRRAAFFASIFAGAITGAALTKFFGPTLTLTVIGVYKMVVGVLFLFNPAEVEQSRA